MTAYVSTVRRPPRTLTDDERDRLLRVTGEHRAGFRDHMIFSVALGTALREFEICGLNVGDVAHPDGRIKRRFPLRVFKRSNRDAAAQQAIVPPTLAYKLTKLLAWKRVRGESLEPDAPLFVSRLGERIATRTVRLLFRTWQARAGFDRIHTFHALRHTALIGAYRRERDVRYVQAVARHSSVQSTMIYLAPGDQEVEDAMLSLTIRRRSDERRSRIEGRFIAGLTARRGHKWTLLAIFTFLSGERSGCSNIGLARC